MICIKRTHEDGDHIWIFCPGCQEAHALQVTGSKAWTWNGDLEKPTFSPSLLCVSKIRCHSFICNGRIKFLGDCEHDLKGQTVDLPELPDWLSE